MQLREDETFIPDQRPDMTYEDKNSQLSADLAVAPNRKRMIVRIERIEIGATGWRIIYRK